MEISLKKTAANAASFTTKFIKTISLVLLVCTATNAAVNAKTIPQVNQKKQIAEYKKAKDNVKQVECLTKNIYYEAGHEPKEGKYAVAQVTINRLESGKFPNSICGVVQQKSVIENRVVCQFSWVCENYAQKPINRQLWEESRQIAKKFVVENHRMPKLKTAFYFHNDQVSPGWPNPKITKIGRHIFYSERKRK